jgi:hypothetical protein
MSAVCPNRVHKTSARLTTKARFTTVEPSLNQLEEPT